MNTWFCACAACTHLLSDRKILFYDNIVLPMGEISHGGGGGVISPSRIFYVVF